MSYLDIFAMIGGLALFLYGMRLMGTGLEHAAGSKLKSILETLTRNRFIGMLVGVALTVLIQSSSATTVMVVGFVNANLMDLAQAVGVIMGANIGTTITGQLIALNITSIAPIFALLGLAVLMFTKRKTVQHVAEVFIGLGFLFMGLGIMSDSLSALRTNEAFIGFMLNFADHPLLAILAGTMFTAIIQSSSASIGILQAFAMQGLITIDNALPLMFGMNIGTCITAAIAAIGASKDAKRAAFIHFLFNIIGTLVFMGFIQIIPFTEWMMALTPNNTVAQIANANTIFKVVTTLLLLPFANILTKISYFVIRGKDRANDDSPRFEHININVGAVSIAMSQIALEVDRMQNLAKSNLHTALESFFQNNYKAFEDVEKNEETIDFLNREITKILIKLNAMELTKADAKHVSSLFHILSDIERIGDHAENIAEYTMQTNQRHVQFSRAAKDELKALANGVYKIIDDTYAFYKGDSGIGMDEIYKLEENIDESTERYTNNHIARMNSKECAPDTGAIFVEVLTDLERIADHALNIAQVAVKEN
ncbi:MAG: Na/Pi cotransporter family protein [Clostridia bacterium]